MSRLRPPASRTSSAGATARATRDPSARAGLALALLVLAARVAHLLDSRLVLDDAFITFRYAENLALGQGFVFNPGERVEGATSFLWTLVLAAARAVGLEPEAVSVALSFAAAAIILLLVGRWAESSGSPGVATPLPALLVAAYAPTARFVVSGMETVAFIALVSLGVYWMVASARPIAAGVAFAASFLMRPEGLAYFIVTLTFAVLLERHAWNRRRCALTVSIVAATAAALTIFRLAYFGSPLPNTVYAKAGWSVERAAEGLRALAAQPDLWGLWWLIVPAAAGVFAGARTAWSWAAVGIFLSGAMEFVLVGGDFLPFFGPRFLLPGVPTLALLAGAGVARLATAFGRHRQLVAFAVGAVLLAGVAWSSWPSRFSRLPGIALQHQAWRDTGLWLRGNAAPESVVATGAAGLIPYVSRLRAVDMFGLTDVHIARHGTVARGHRTAGHERFDPGYVLDRRPAYVFSRISASGTPTTAGLGGVTPRLSADYLLIAQIKDRLGPPPHGSCLAPVAAFSKPLWDDGYQSGLFQRAPIGPRATRP